MRHLVERVALRLRHRCSRGGSTRRWKRRKCRAAEEATRRFYEVEHLDGPLFKSDLNLLKLFIFRSFGGPKMFRSVLSVVKRHGRFKSCSSSFSAGVCPKAASSARQPFTKARRPSTPRHNYSIIDIRIASVTLVHTRSYVFDRRKVARDFSRGSSENVRVWTVGSALLGRCPSRAEPT